MLLTIIDEENVSLQISSPLSDSNDMSLVDPVLDDSEKWGSGSEARTQSRGSAGDARGGGLRWESGEENLIGWNFPQVQRLPSSKSSKLIIWGSFFTIVVNSVRFM